MAERKCFDHSPESNEPAIDLLTEANPDLQKLAIDRAVQEGINGMVPSDAVLPEGWKRFDIGGGTPKGRKRVNKRRRRARS